MTGNHAINPLVTEDVENQLERDINSIIDDAGVHFQQDGVAPHNILPVPQWLNYEFSDRWIQQSTYKVVS